MRGPWRKPRRGEEVPLPVDTGDGALVVAAQNGDPRAFALLYDRYQDLVLRYCFYRLGSWDEAGDAAQEVFASALSSLKRFRDNDGEPFGSFRTWLFRIAHNEVADRHRRRGRHELVPETEAADVVDPAPSPETLAVAADDERRLREVLALLPPEQRAVSELRLAELSGPEIARILGLSHDAVRKAQSRAVARLRDLLTAQIGEEAPRG